MIRALLASLIILAVPATAQTVEAPAARPPAAAPSAALQSRIDALPAILHGIGDFDSYFSDAFKAQVGKAQFAQLSAQIGAKIGEPVRVESITPTSPYAATLTLGFTKGVATILIVVDSAPPHIVTGLRITQVAPRGDSLEAIAAELRALPGMTAFAVHALGQGAPRPLYRHAADVALPIGSTFKLWVLAEAVRQVDAGQRRWSDVVTLGSRSLPTGATQAWPPASPVTLHTLATLMISISDNTATDTLMAALGRDRVDAVVAVTGVANHAATLPLLTTMEALRLKAPANADLAAQWRTARPETRTKLLRDNAARLAGTQVDAAMFGDRPLALDIEWFASADDIARTLDWLRVHGGEQALGMLAINPGGTSAALFDYIGYKGGSEPGVISGAWLVRTKQGQWYALTGAWVRGDARVDDARFIALMNRALSQIAPR